MSIECNMQRVELLEKETVCSPSGALDIKWFHKGYLDVSITDNSSSVTNKIITNGAQYSKVTNFGLTYYVGIKKGSHRIVHEGMTFDIEEVKSGGRYTQLFLNAVITNG